MTEEKDERGHDGLTDSERIEQMLNPPQDDWYNHQISIVNKRNAELESHVQQLEQWIGRLREALEARRVADRMWLDDSPHNLCHSQTKHAKELADAALKESE